MSQTLFSPPSFTSTAKTHTLSVPTIPIVPSKRISNPTNETSENILSQMSPLSRTNQSAMYNKSLKPTKLITNVPTSRSNQTSILTLILAKDGTQKIHCRKCPNQPGSYHDNQTQIECPMSRLSPVSPLIDKLIPVCYNVRVEEQPVRYSELALEVVLATPQGHISSAFA